MIYDVLPYSDHAAVMDVPGSVIWEVMEQSLTTVGHGAFLQISGMTVTYDPDGAEGGRVVSIQIAGSPIDPDASYKLATVDFL